ncbi:hypothetical protein DN752_03715 [Echinicola strongylocentroti]|uniref:Transporter n=1 Tax=Echinicola strongylocentroti TaxID=1795355 RepID=A0A2Z4IEX6_9BACT|nr:hypothetical protein [Echinicola strongylocentroti]AWW29319.1 hypothetical protein DN752_03715 [Echinicola strongylocentroti]
MRKKLIILFITLTFPLLSKEAKACDSCNFFEYSLLQNRSYIGLFYRHRQFGGYDQYGYSSPSPGTAIVTPNLTNGFENGATTKYVPNARKGIFPAIDQDFIVMHEPEGTGLYVNKTDQDWETYETVELRGNFTLQNKWNFTFILPYESNRVHYQKMLDLPNPVQDTTLTVHGWGDLTVAADYIHYIYNDKARHTFRPGLAIVAPTGQSNKVASNDSPFDPIIQPGTGSWSYVARLNYQLFYTKTGLNAGFSYKQSTEGAQNYQFGNSFNASAIGFHQLSFKDDWMLVPNAGAYYEQSQEDTWTGEKQQLTGGKVAFAQAGLDINRQEWTLSLMWQTPVYQDLKGNQIHHQDRISIGIIKAFKL